MELKHPTTKLPDPETETPPQSQSQSLNLLSIPNGKTHHHPPPHTAAAAYKECLKNHAAAIGGHALDGCGEFMPSEPPSFQCAACGCHRNFHRREPTRTHFIDFHRPHHTSTSPSSPSPPSPPTNYAYGQHLLLSLTTTAEQNHTVSTPGTPLAIKISGRKRFRTKFSQDQKEKMLTFAEKVGWKMQRCDDKMVADFCNEIGIRRGIFKVWMHNNKNTFTKREKDTTTTAIATATNAEASALERNNDVHLQDSTNGSSSLS